MGQLRAANFVWAGKKAPKGKSNGEFGSIKDCNLNSDKWSVVKGTCDLIFMMKKFKIFYIKQYEREVEIWPLTNFESFWYSRTLS